MSLVNIVMNPDRALIATDTHVQFMSCVSTSVSEAIARAQAGGFSSSKFDYLPHANIVMTCRGVSILGTIAFGTVKLSGISDFDHVVTSMSQWIADATRQATELLRQQGVNHFEGCEITLVGYSQALGRMEAVRWVRQPSDRVFSVAPVAGVSLMPDAEWSQPPEPPITDEAMEAVARDQVQYCIDRWPGGEYRLGGRLLLAELTRDSLSVRTIAKLD